MFSAKKIDLGAFPAAERSRGEREQINVFSAKKIDLGAFPAAQRSRGERERINVFSSKKIDFGAFPADLGYVFYHLSSPPSCWFAALNRV